MKIDSMFNIFTALILCTSFPSCEENEGENRFPLASEHDVDGIMLTVAFNDFIKVDGALSLIVCRNGKVIAEEYTYYKNYVRTALKMLCLLPKALQVYW
jgi:hypothetical protein